MKFLCGNCKTKYQISEEKVRNKVLTIRCQKCGTMIVVRENINEKSEERTATTALGANVAAVTRASKVAMGAGPMSSVDLANTPSTGMTQFDATKMDWYTALEGVQSGPVTYAELLRKLSSREIDG